MQLYVFTKIYVSIYVLGLCLYLCSKQMLYLFTMFVFLLANSMILFMY